MPLQRAQTGLSGARDGKNADTLPVHGPHAIQFSNPDNTCMVHAVLTALALSSHTQVLDACHRRIGLRRVPRPGGIAPANKRLSTESATCLTVILRPAPRHRHTGRSLHVNA